MATPFRLKGWHVLAMLLGFFALIASVNAIFITLAMQSFPGEEEKKSYVQGLQYNDRLEERNAQAELGWTVELTEVLLVDGLATIDLTFKNAAGTSISGLDVSGRIAHPVRDDYDQQLDFLPMGEGVYRAQVSGLNSGLWKLKAQARNDMDEIFNLETKLELE